MIVIFYFDFVIDGREYESHKSFEEFTMHLPRIGDHIDPPLGKQKVYDVGYENLFTMVLPSNLFVVYKVVHILNDNVVTVHCEAD